MGGGGGRREVTTTPGPGNKNVRIAAPLFIPATRDGRLAAKLRAEEDEYEKNSLLRPCLTKNDNDILLSTTVGLATT